MRETPHCPACRFPHRFALPSSYADVHPGPGARKKRIEASELELLQLSELFFGKTPSHLLRYIIIILIVIILGLVSCFSSSAVVPRRSPQFFLAV